MTTHPLPTNDPNIVEFAAADNVVVIRYVDGTIKVWDTATSPESNTVVAPYTIATPPTAIHKIAAGQVFDPPSLWNRYHALLDTSGVIQIAQPQSEGEFANATIANLIPASLQGHATDIFILEQGLYAVHTNGSVYAINHEAATIIDCKSNPIYIGGGLCRGTHADDVFYTVFLYQDGTISVDGPPMYQPPANLPNVKAISASSSHTLALLHDGQVVAWGDNQLGACNVPADLANVVAITAGEDYSVALLADGTIRGWGENGEGQYAFPADLPKVRQVKAAIYQTYVLTESGSVIKSHHPTHFDVPEHLRV